MRKVFVALFALMMIASASFATTIAEIQTVDDPASDDASPLVDTEVTVTGWITFEPMSAGGNKFWIADAAGAWNGVYVYTGDTDYHLGFGWQVEVTGTVEEYSGLTEINASAGSVTVLNDDVDWTDLPEACDYTLVESLDGMNDAATAEQYEGVLVKVMDVHCSNPDGGYGEWWIADDNDNELLIDNPQDGVYGYVHSQVQDMPYEYIQGPLSYSYGNYKIVPEIAFDIKVAQDGVNWFTPFAWFQQVRPMDMTVQEDANGNLVTNDYSYASLARYGHSTQDSAGYTQYVHLHGLVTAPTGLYYAGVGVKFMMYDWENGSGDESAPWSGVLSYDPDSTAFPNLYVGDEIKVFGYIDEYVTGPGHMTELWILSAPTIESVDNPIPEPATVSTEELRTAETAEQWGNVFVKVTGGVVTDDNLAYEMFTIDDNLDDEIDGVNVDDDTDSLDVATYPIPPIGTQLDSVMGWIYHHYGSNDPTGHDWAYKLCPQGPSDIVLGEGPPNIMSVMRNPGAPGADEVVNVIATISDNSQVTSATIYWKVGVDGTYNTVAMTNTGGITWEGEIPAQADGTNVWYYLMAEDDNSTTTTSPSNTDENLYGFWAMDELGVYEVQWTPFSAGISPYANALVTVSGVITTMPENYDAYGCYFIQTGNEAPFSGLCVDIPDTVAAPQLGDNVTVTGTVDEDGTLWGFKWGGNTMLIDVVDCTINSSNHNWTTYTVTTADVNAALEAHESVFCSFQDITISAVNQYDWSFTDGSGETFLLDDDMVPDADTDALDWYAALEEGTTIDWVSGIVTFSFGTWKLEPRGSEDIAGLSGVNDDFTSVPAQFILEQNYPNPFNPSTFVRFGIPEANQVKLVVYNTLGQKVRTLIDAPQKAGYHVAYWNGLSDGGSQVASGTYFMRLFVGGNQKIIKMTLTK